MAKGRRGAGEGSIFERRRTVKLKNGSTTEISKWYGEITLGRDENGNRKVLRHTADTRKEVATWLKKTLADQETGNLVVSTKETLTDYITRWIDETVAHEVAPTTLQLYKNMRSWYIVPHLGHYQLSQLQPETVRQFYHQLLTQGLSPRTVQIARTVLRRALQQAVDDAKIPKNPVASTKAPRVERKDAEVLAPEQILQFLNAAGADRLHALFNMAVMTGLREGELLGLRWDDIDLAQKMVTVRQILKWVDGEPVFGPPKTKTSRRTVELPQRVVDHLKTWHREQTVERMKLGPDWQMPDLTFSSVVGSPISRQNLRKRDLHRVLDRAGLPHIPFHALRHTAATLMLSEGVNPRVLQEILGHADVGITLRVYSHVLPRQRQEAAQKFDDFLAAEEKKARTRA